MDNPLVDRLFLDNPLVDHHLLDNHFVGNPLLDNPLMENLPQRRSLRRAALSEINDTQVPQTPKATSPDELVIIQRGPRRKPLTWSPYEYDRSKLLGPPREKSPELRPSQRPELNSKLRRRLVMTPEKNSQRDLGEAIAKKLKSLPRFDGDESTNHSFDSDHSFDGSHSFDGHHSFDGNHSFDINNSVINHSFDINNSFNVSN